VRLERADTPHHSDRGKHRISMVIIHGDAGKTDAGTLAWLKDPTSRVSYHYLVGRDGTVHQLVDEAQKAWHAGVSSFHGEEIEGSINPISIGVAFANNGKGDEPYTLEQYDAGAELVADVCRRRSIPLHRIRGHFEVSPGRKQDPWSWFAWPEFYRLLGLYSRRLA
jgi:N-acetylmuramoyl-L-alanine amidase